MQLSLGSPAIVAALALLATAGCNPVVQGNGVFHEETRSVPAFLGVSAEDGILVTVTAGGAQRVTVSGDENVVQHVETTVHTDVALGIQVLEAKVTFVDSYTSVHPLRLTVTVPELQLVRVQDPTRVEAKNVAAERFRVEAGDGGDVVLAGAGTGAAPVLEVVLSGVQHGAHLDAREYAVATSDVTLTGSSRAELQASLAVTGTAVPGSRVENSGTGTCRVTDGAGDPVSCAIPAP
ncbi:GIN domain-containing protein [Anaeromyxobacter oryzae]|uniref:Putative auto-transporter adhesin head GIN domain-containing protein n=1 Tax=Anaeromyxobacter oryzae TaxID=2918170 RepID=A0ABM7WV03_9BACT|nr:DUF2807 domain-containing protein [Anaeromyxobacter oryzae]BDG03339.1 hypothetical protein AMOR_23350 [Anaeromyxobacter oryzae]